MRAKLHWQPESSGEGRACAVFRKGGRWGEGRGPRVDKPTYLIEKALGELLEALGAHKALLVVQFTVAVDDFLGGREATLAALTGGAGQGVGHVATGDKGQDITGCRPCLGHEAERHHEPKSAFFLITNTEFHPPSPPPAVP